MKRELGKLDLQTVVVFQFLDTPGDEVAPGSDKIRKNFENKRFRHKYLLFQSFQWFQSFKPLKTFQPFQWFQGSTVWEHVAVILWLLALGSQRDSPRETRTYTVSKLR